MNYSIQLSLCFLCLLSYSQQPITNSFDIDKTFSDWNQSTIKSIEKHILLTKNDVQNSLYVNRLIAFKTFNNINNLEHFNVNSIRYKFLERIKKDYSGVKDFYILESNQSGEQIVIRNFVLRKTSEKKIKVEVYEFKNNLWKNSKSSFKVNLNDNLEVNFIKFGTGFNQEDVIITKIKKNKVNYSEFYLFTTLSSEWKQVLSK